MTKLRKVPKEEEQQLSTESLHECNGGHKGCALVAQTDSAPSFSSRGSRKITTKEIELVQNLIERCLVLYMTRDEVIVMLENRAKLEPYFVSLVWQRLEEENPEFFSAYYIRLDLKKQIILFNQLLEKQYHLMKNKEYYNATQHSLPNGLNHFPVDSSIGYPAQQPYFPCTGTTYVDPLHDGSLNYVVTGVPSAGNFYHNQQSVDAASGDQDMDTGVNTQIFFELDETLWMSNQSVPPFDAAFPSNLFCIDAFQLGMDGGSPHRNVTTHSFTSQDCTAFRSSLPAIPGPIPDIEELDIVPDECDLDDFLTDVPCPESEIQRDEEKL